MASVKFNLKDDSKRESLIMARIYFDAKSFKYSTKQKVEVLLWDKSKQRAKVPQTHRQYSYLNVVLDSLVSKISKIHMNFQANEVNPTVEEFKKELVIDKRIDVISYMKKFNNAKEKRVKLTGFRAYRATLTHLENFTKRKDIEFKDLDLKFYHSFTSFLYENYNLSSNTVGSYIRVIKEICRSAIRDSIPVNSAFKSPEFKAPSQETDKIYLNKNELDKLFQTTLSGRLEEVRDAFIIGAYTGLRWSDFSRHKNANIQEVFIEKLGEYRHVITIRSKKVNKEATIPLNKNTKLIIDKYTLDGVFRFPEQVTITNFNKRIKQACRIAKLNTKVQVVSSVGGKPRVLIIEKCEIVSSHTARRSFASNMILAGMDIQIIMLLGGWKNRQSFERYIRISTKEAAIKAIESGFFD